MAGDLITKQEGAQEYLLVCLVILQCFYTASTKEELSVTGSSFLTGMDRLALELLQEVSMTSGNI